MSFDAALVDVGRRVGSEYAVIPAVTDVQHLRVRVLTRGCERCSIARRRRSSASRAGMGDRDRLYGVEAAALSARPYSARHGRAAGVATGRAKIAGETHPSVIGASQATARSPPYPDPKHITLRSQPVEGAIPNRWRANPVIKRPYGPTRDGHPPSLRHSDKTGPGIYSYLHYISVCT